METTLNPRTFSWLEVTRDISYELADAAWVPNSEITPFSSSFSSMGLSQANERDWERRQWSRFSSLVKITFRNCPSLDKSLL